MVRCKSHKCQEKWKKITDDLMATVPQEYRYDYLEVRKRVKYIPRQDWLNWLGRNPR